MGSKKKFRKNPNRYDIESILQANNHIILDTGILILFEHYVSSNLQGKIDLFSLLLDYKDKIKVPYCVIGEFLVQSPDKYAENKLKIIKELKSKNRQVVFDMLKNDKFLFLPPEREKLTDLIRYWVQNNLGKHLKENGLLEKVEDKSRVLHQHNGSELSETDAFLVSSANSLPSSNLLTNDTYMFRFIGDTQRTYHSNIMGDIKNYRNARDYLQFIRLDTSNYSRSKGHL